MGNTPSIRRFSKYQKNQVVFYGDIFGFKQCMDDIDRNKNYERNDKDGIFVDLDIIYNAEIYKIDEKREFKPKYSTPSLYIIIVLMTKGNKIARILFNIPKDIFFTALLVLFIRIIT